MNDEPNTRSHLSSLLLGWFGALSVITFALWLSADQRILAGPSAYDDEWFIRSGDSFYWFEDGYSRSSFLKEPTYPLFIAATSRLGLSLRFAHEVFYLIAAGLLSYALIYRHSRSWVGVVVFALIATMPAHFSVFERATHDSIYSTLVMLASAAMLWQYKRRGEKRRWLRWIATGLTLGLLWNTRQERALVIALAVPILAAGLVASWRSANRKRAALFGWVVEWMPPVAIVAVLTVAIMAANQHRWGVFALNNLSTPRLKEAYTALLRIKPDRPIPHVTVTRDMRRKAYAVSPRFRELEASLEGHLLAWNGAWDFFQDIPPGEYSGGWFIILFREAVAEAGHYRSGPESEAFYAELAAELRAAEADGQLATRTLAPGMGWAVHPDLETYVHRFLPSWRSLWFHVWSLEGSTAPSVDPDVTTPEIRELFDRVACRPVTSFPGPTPQSIVRAALWTIYARFAEPSLAAGCLLAGAILTFGKQPGWMQYLLPALSLGSYGLARMALFTLFDASVFAGSEMRYYFPQALALSIVAVWLLADGVNLLLGRFRVGTEVPSSDDRLRRCAGVTITIFAALLFAQWGFGRIRLPDYNPSAGELERADATEISGWARIKERPDVPAGVELYSDDVLIATAVADQFRQDLVDRQIGNGRHYFRIPTPDMLKDGKPHNIRVKIAGTNYVLAAPTTITLPERGK